MSECVLYRFLLQVSAADRALGPLALGPWTVDHFALFESDLTPNGAIYSQLTRFPHPAR